jgi:N-formylglutamate deformylase
MGEMHMEKLPVLLSIPHSGTKTPEELKDRICLEQVDIGDDSDAFSLEVYDLGDRVAHVVSTDIARAFVDMNRAPDDLPPQNPDGVIKSHTCYSRVIYKAGLEPDEALIRELLENYYAPYHRQIRQALAERDSKIELALDCHAMSDTGPDVAPDPHQKRPLLCLGNVYGTSCSQEKIDRLTDCFRQAFGFKTSEVTQNQPFAGAYITRTYGGNPIPWIQVEMNQVLYLEPRHSDREVLRSDQTRLQEVHRKFEQTLRLFFAHRG